MAKYISIEVDGRPDLVFNTKDITLVVPNGTTEVLIYTGSVFYIFGWDLAIENPVTAYTVVNNINKAILTVNGPTCVKVVNTGGTLVLANILPV